jgi:hypothetical protein
MELSVESVVEPKVKTRELAALEEKVNLYLQAWRAPDPARAEFLGEVMRCARAGAFSDQEREAIEFLEQAIKSRHGELGVEIWDESEIAKALFPQRPLETHLTIMETSLSRMPSFRIIAGWFLLITSLVLAFIFTH